MTSLMSRIQIPRFSDLDESSQLEKVQATADLRLSHWEESRQKQKKSSGKGKSSKSSSSSLEKKAEQQLKKLSKEQIEKLKREAGL